MTQPLHRFWIRFDDPQRFKYGVGLGCGVTALNLDDARGLLERDLFKGPIPFPIASVIEDVDVSTLDRGHVLPNMMPPNVRGIWFPAGLSPASASR